MENRFVIPLLTAREKEIINLIVLEYSNKEIAEKLCVSFETIKTHRKHIKLKLQVKNVAGVVRKAIMHNLLKSPLRQAL
mgnify:CR=1 FL=1